MLNSINSNVSKNHWIHYSKKRWGQKLPSCGRICFFAPFGVLPIFFYFRSPPKKQVKSYKRKHVDTSWYLSKYLFVWFVCVRMVLFLHLWVWDMQPVFGQVAPPTGLEFEKNKVFDIWNFGSKQKSFWGPTDALKLWFKKRVPWCFLSNLNLIGNFCL